MRNEKRNIAVGEPTAHWYNITYATPSSLWIWTIHLNKTKWCLCYASA